MARPRSAMRRQLVALERGFGQESQQDAGLAHLEENVTARLLADDPQAQDSPVEGFRSLEVIDVDGGFDDRLDAHVPAPFNPVPPARHPPGPGRESSAPLSGLAVPARLRFGR